MSLVVTLLILVIVLAIGVDAETNFTACDWRGGPLQIHSV
jgi:hypothetical protein